jgi:hypothetical protein
MSRQYITIQNPKISSDKRISVDLSCSKGIRKYLLSDKLYVEYDMPISGLTPSILQIPAVSGVITVAWAVGADIYIDELDKTYLEYIRRWQSVVKRWRSNFSGTGTIHTGKVVSNNFVNDGKGLLFTRGVDSIASYIKHNHEKPVLIHVWGTDVRPDDEETWKKMLNRLTDFATIEKVPLHIIRTNIPRAVNMGLLYVRFGLDWWQQVSHAVVLTGLCAPLTCAANIGTLYMASSTTPDWKYAGGSNPVGLAKMSWGGTHVEYDNYEISRQLKIRYFMKDYIKSHGGIFLKVCNNVQRPESNCGKCGKCLRTITELVLEGIDPNKCGFSNVNGNTFHRIKEEFEKERFFRKKWIVESEGDAIKRIGEAYYWQDMQKHILETIENSPAGSESFLEWFRDFNFQDYLRRTENNIEISLVYFLHMCLLSICYHMPESTQRSVKRFLDFWTGFLQKNG